MAKAAERKGMKEIREIVEITEEEIKKNTEKVKMRE